MLVLLGLAGCSDQASAPPLSEKEKEMVAVARRAVAQFETWPDNAEYVIERRGQLWRVSAWRVVHPEAKGRQRFVPWGVRIVSIDDTGRVVAYGTGK